MAKKLSTKYKEFLASEPIVTSACKSMSDDMLIEFVCEVLRLPRRDRNLLEESMAWYLFEEIGWPEGCRYVQDAVIAGRYQYLVDSLRQNLNEKIHSRLELRRSHWKRPSQASFVAAHDLLDQLLGAVCAPGPHDCSRVTPTPPTHVTDQAS